ncbi:MAG: DUF4340 domain-containing protein [Nitrosomonadales bacterium]|nr:DUF4340 domain-containing protein [Nitrosomonadales bacterium]
MNFTKKTLFWVIVLIALSGVFFLFDKKQDEVKQVKEANLRLLPFAVKDIGEFWIYHIKENLRVQVVRGKEGWQLAQPLSAKGDAKAIEKFLTNVVTARKDAVLFDRIEPAKLAELGLAAPEIEMGLKAGGEETVIVFGEKGPTHNIAYVMFKGKPEVYRVHSDLKKEAGKDAYALRDKTILDFDPVKMRRLEIVTKDMRRVVVEQDQGKWNLLEPTRERAAMAKVLELLYVVKNGEIKAFADENPADLTPYGLSSPMLQLTVYQEQKETPYILTIGDKDRAKRAYFARTNQQKKVFDVEEDMVNTILLSMDKLAEGGAAR